MVVTEQTIGRGDNNTLAILERLASLPTLHNMLVKINLGEGER